jgi:multiple sugar transport system substrate-binding protein
MLQNGADPTDPIQKEAQDALTFYANFAVSDDVWDETLPNSTVAFARGDVAMMIAPSWRAHEIDATNPDLAYGVTTAPQLSSTNITWGTYWAEGVNAQSQNKDKAWALLKYLSSAEGQRLLYAEQSKVRGFGEPYSRIDLASEVADNEVVSTVLSQAPEAQNWYLNSYTFDNGLNDQITKYYQDAINAMLDGDGADGVVPTVSQGTQQVLRQFGVTSN